MRHTHTHTFVLMDVSPLAYAEIKDTLIAAGYAHAINSDGYLDMHGIALRENNAPTLTILDESNTARHTASGPMPDFGAEPPYK